MPALRRHLAAALLLWACGGGCAHAGAQREEALADPVRLALANQIADAPQGAPPFPRAQELIDYLQWLATETVRLRRQIPDLLAREQLLRAVWYEAHRAGLEPELVLGLIQVESGFQKYAISNAGAMGLMQVMPFWTAQIGNGDKTALFDMRINLRFGCVILRHYLDEENGDLFMALGRYNGSRGLAPYPDAVLAARRAWIVGDR
jgi:soluble lytic murein transglycosylase-like protein